MVSDLDLDGDGWALGVPEREDDGDVTCPRCGEPVDPNDFACEACGRALADLEPVEEAVASW